MAYSFGYLTKSYVDVSGFDVDYDIAARRMVEYAKERYRPHSLRYRGPKEGVLVDR